MKILFDKLVNFDKFKKHGLLIALLGCSIFLALIFCEIGIRLYGHFDTEGDFYVNTLRCYPYHLSVKTEQIEINKYLASKDNYLIYDRNLGWAPRPRSKSQNGLYFYNKDGIRTLSVDTKISKSPSAGLMRILIFGDSFTHGDNVSFKNTWGYYLEDDLKKHHINAEVLNFGVGGYGMDQAFLRWKELGHIYKPSIVIFGLQLENISRNVNLIRRILCPLTGIPFAKPRFLLNNGDLSLIDVPTPGPERTVDIMNHFSSWQWAKDEYWYEPGDYQENILFRSKLIAFVYSWIKGHYNENRTHDENLEKLALRIVMSFKEDVESEGSKFFVVYLPLKDDMKLKDQTMLPYPNLLNWLEKSVPVIRPESEMLKKEKDLQQFIPDHYSAQANKTLADVIAGFLLKTGQYQLPVVPHNFNWQQYVANYPDLQRAGINTKEKAEMHWLEFGYFEKRNYRKSAYE